MTNTNAWQIASVNFREDDGSLPAVAFTNISPEGVAKVYQFIAATGRCVSESPTIWDDVQQKDIPLMSVDPCQWLREGRIGSFQCCFAVTHEGVAIPDLGIFAFPDLVELDFRMGSEWNPVNVDAFLKLLGCLHRLAPESTIQSAETEGLMDEALFLIALRPYLNAEGKSWTLDV